MNLSVLRIRQSPGGLVAFGVAGATAFGMFLVIALYLQQGLGRTALYSGLVSAAWLGAYGIAAPVLQRMPVQYGRLLAPIGCATMTGAFAGLSVNAATGNLDAVPMIGSLALGGFGFALCRIVLTDRISSAVPPRYAADISGLINTDSYVTAAARVALFRTAYQRMFSVPGAQAAMRGFAIVSAAFAVASLVAAACAVSSVGCARLVDPRKAPHVGAR